MEALALILPLTKYGFLCHLYVEPSSFVVTVTVRIKMNLQVFK